MIDHGKVYSLSSCTSPLESRSCWCAHRIQARWSLSLTAIEAYGSCQVAARSWYSLAAPRNDKAHQYANGSILESSTASRNVPVSRKREHTTRYASNTLFMQSARAFHIIRTHAQLVVLDIGQSEMQYRRRCACVCSLKE